jgi:hypothetical protein
MNHHKPKRREVAWDGRTYVGQCRHCGIAIERQRRGIWCKREDEAHKQSDAPTQT